MFEGGGVFQGEGLTLKRAFETHRHSCCMAVQTHLEQLHELVLTLGIPTLIILGWDGTVINANGRNAVAADQEGIVSAVCVREVLVCEGGGSV